MADHLINGRAYAFRKSLIIQRSRNTSHTNCHGMYQIIYFLCGYARSDHFSHSVQNSHIDLTAFADSFNLLCRL